MAMLYAQLIFSGLVALSTLVYAFLTWRLVAETRRMREVQTEPRVSVLVELNDQHGHGGMDLVIRNEGQGPAQNVRFEFQGDPTYFDTDRPIDQLPVIKNGLPYLGPNQTFRFLMGWLFGDRFMRANEAPWTFDVSYENQMGKLKEGHVRLGFLPVFASDRWGGGTPISDCQAFGISPERRAQPDYGIRQAQGYHTDQAGRARGEGGISEATEKPWE